MSGTPMDAPKPTDAEWDRARGWFPFNHNAAGSLAYTFAAVRAEATEAAQRPRRFPVMTGNGAGRDWIPWSLAEEAYAKYSAEQGTSQSLERLAERGGFHDNEMDLFVPDWRERASEIYALRAERDAALAQLRESQLAQAQLLTDTDQLAADRDRAQALLAQREAEASALHEGMRRHVCCAFYSERDAQLVADTAPVALAYATTLKAKGAREEREKWKPLRVLVVEFVTFASTGHGARPLTTNEVHIVVQQMDEALAALSAHRADPEEEY